MSIHPLRPRRILLLAAALVFAAHAAPPPESPYSMPQPPFFGQVRARTEFDHKAMTDTNLNKSLMSTHVRTRLGFLATPSEKVEIKVEMQDTRTFGSEPQGANAPHTASVGVRSGVDLLQGYVAIQEGPMKAVLGRQKMSLGAGRFLSTLEWSPTSRAFDGVSFNWAVGGGDLTGLTYLVRDTATSTTTTPSTAAATDDRLMLSGLYYNRKVGESLAFEGGVFYDKSTVRNITAGDTLNRYDLVYLDARASGAVGLFAFDLEGIYQGGKARAPGARELTSAAWQLAARAGVALPRIKANVGLDLMSGDSDPADDKTTQYRANYYFAHQYFGWMDYFVNNPRFGVIDYRADVDAMLWQTETQSASLKAQYHYFTPHDAPSGADDPYGQEINAELHLGLYPKSNIVIGAGAFIPGDNAFRLAASKVASAAAPTETGFFFYFMPVFNF